MAHTYSLGEDFTCWICGRAGGGGEVCSAAASSGGGRACAGEGSASGGEWCDGESCGSESRGFKKEYVSPRRELTSRR